MRPTNLLLFVLPILSGCGEPVPTAEQMAHRLTEDHMKANKERENQAVMRLTSYSNEEFSNTKTFKVIIDEIMAEDWGQIASMATGMGLLNKEQLAKEQERATSLLRGTQNKLKKPLALIFQELDRREKEIGEKAMVLRTKLEEQVMTKLKTQNPNLNPEDLRGWIQEVKSIKIY